MRKRIAVQRASTSDDCSRSRAIHQLKIDRQEAKRRRKPAHRFLFGGTSSGGGSNRDPRRRQSK